MITVCGDQHDVIIVCGKQHDMITVETNMT